jgi:hypothetical protein
VRQTGAVSSSIRTTGYVLPIAIDSRAHSAAARRANTRPSISEDRAIVD